MLVVGHRGWLGAYPENTLAGFKAALELGVDAIELDIHVTSDGRVAVIHDDTVDRTTDGVGVVSKMTLAELKALDAGAWFGERFAGERIPTLEEVMELVDGKVALAIEVKPPRETETRLNEAFGPLLEGYAGEFIVHSFDGGYLQRFRAAHPGVTTGFLCAASAESIARTKEIGCEAIHAAWQTVSPEINRAMRDADLKIMVWVARKEFDCRHIAQTIDAGPDCPDLMMKVLQKMGKR